MASTRPSHVARVLFTLVCALLLSACGTSRGHMPYVGTDVGDQAMQSTDPCALPNEGCACSDAGASVGCGSVTSQNSGYVACAMGERTCDGTSWGACLPTGQNLLRERPAAPSGFSVLGLGTQQSCAAQNPCDPNCENVTDTATGIGADAGTNLNPTSTGISLTQTATLPQSVACNALTIAPAASTLTVTQFSPVSPSTVQFTATVSPSGCYPGTPPVLWAIDRFDIATISSSGLFTLVAPYATRVNVTAYAGSLSATTTLDIQLKVVDTSAAPSGCPSNTSGCSTKFNSMTGTADTTALLYPYANTVLPLGLLAPLVQWSTGATGAATAVKVSLRYPATGTATFDWSEILTENQSLSLNPPTNSITLAAGPRATIPQAVWQAFERTAKGNDALIVLQRLTGSLSGTTTLRTELPTTLHFATNQLKGTVYYQSYGTNLVQNYSSTYSPQTIGAGQRFGAATLAITPGATYPTVAAGYTSSTDGPGCRVCHTAASGGSAIITNLFSSSDSILFRPGVDTSSGGLSFPVSNTGLYAWSALYPDGSMTFGNSGPSPTYSGATAPGGMDGTAWVSGAAPANQLYSLAPATLGSTLSSSGIPSGLRAAMPIFSPDGTYLAFNHYAGTVGSAVGDKRSLGVMAFNATTRTFSGFRRLVNQSTSACSGLFGTTDPCTNVWPTFLPGNEGVIFEREIFNNGRVAGAGHADFGGTRSGCDGSGTCGDDGTKAELWWVSLSTTTSPSPPAPVRLNQANGLKSDGTLYLPTGSNSHTSTNEPILDYEPTMCPKAIGGYYWVAFTSRRLYGNVATVNPWWSDPRFKAIGGANGPTTKKIWVAAIDASTAASSTTADLSHPAFYLPGQELLAGNSKAYWALNSCITASNTRSTATQCETDLDCCNAPAQAVCSLQTPITSPATRNCIPVSSSSCIADGSATQCSSDAQCCGFSTGSRCANGVCAQPPPLLLYTTGSMTRDFQAQCPSGQKPLWQNFQWQAKLPTGTSIVFTAATAATSAALASAPTVAAGTALPPDTTTWATNPVNLQTAFSAIGGTSRNYLRVGMTINPSSDRLSAPTLTNWRIIYDCVDAE